MEKYYELLYDNIFYERQLVLLLAITDPGYLKVKGYTDSDVKMIKDIADSKIHRQKLLKEYFASQLLNDS